MSETLVQLLVLAGSVLMLLAGLGVMRMPDLYMRLSTVTKGSTLGLILLLCGVMVEFDTLAALIKVAAVLVFSFVTSPVSAHMLSRAAYFQRVALWEGTFVDELRGRYEMSQHRLASPEPGTTRAAEVLGGKPLADDQNTSRDGRGKGS